MIFDHYFQTTIVHAILRQRDGFLINLNKLYKGDHININ